MGEWAGYTLIDGAVLLGVVVVLPLALGGGWWRWLAAGAGVAVALPQDRGLAATVGVLPWLVLAAAQVGASVRRAGPLLFWARDDTIQLVAAGYALVAAGALVVSRAGARLFNIREPLVELTAVHYLFAGTGALVLAGAAQGPRWAVRWAVGLTAAAPPIVALGFVARQAVPQVGGAGLMALGVGCTAGLQLHELVTDRGRPTGRRVLLAVSGLAVWAPMVLAVAWAAGQHGDVPHLAVADMVPLHGMPNALGFTVGGLVARHGSSSGMVRADRDEGDQGCG